MSASIASAVVAGTVVAASAAHGARSGAASHARDALDAPAAPTHDEARALIAPLASGSALGRWSVEHVGTLEHGALPVVLTGATGRIALEIVARDATSSQRAPGMTRHFAVLVNNHGDGALATDEDQGLAAMALAEVVLANEEHMARAGFLTQAERLSAHRARLLGDDWPDDVAPSDKRPLRI